MSWELSNKFMKAIIVAGGRGERLRPITDKIPKPMVEISGRPILLHIINLFKKHGISDFIIPLCYLPNVITEFFGDGSKFGVKIIYTYEDPQNPLGTAGAISLAKDLINNTFIVAYADILRDLDINKMIDFHKKNGSFATINIYRRKSKDAKSAIIIDKNKKMVKFIERPNQKTKEQEYIWVNGSFYIFEPEIFEFIPNDKKVDFGSDIFPKLLKSNKNLFGFIFKGYLVDIGNIEKLEYARRTFRLTIPI